MRVCRILIRALVPLALRHLATHKLAATVTTISVGFGVAALLAACVLYRSVVTSYEATAERLAGRAALEVANGDAGVGEELAEELRVLPEVAGVAPSVEGFVALADHPGERLYLYGIDLLADQEVRDYGGDDGAVVSDPLAFLAAPDSIALTRELAGALGIRDGDPVRLLTPAGIATLTVRAQLGGQHGPASVLDGRLAVVDLSVAQELLRMPGRVSQLAIIPTSGADLVTVERAVADVVATRAAVERPRSRTATFTRLLANYRYGLLLTATMAMVVALFFVFNVATIAVAARRRELGLFRVIGAHGWQLAFVVIAEMATLTTIGTALGLPLGFGLARWLGDTFGATAGALYGEPLSTRVHVAGTTLLSVAAVGATTPLLAIMQPLRRALAVRPCDTLRARDDLAGPLPRFAASALTGCVTLVGAMLVWRVRRQLPIAPERIGALAMLAGLVGVAWALPSLIAWLLDACQRLATRMRTPCLVLALRSLRADLRAVVMTSAALVIGIAGTIAVVTWMSSLDATLAAAFDTVFGSVDLVVSAGGDPYGPEAIRMPETVAREVARLSDVEFVDGIRIDRLAFEGSRIAVVASDATLYRDGRRRLHLIEGDAADVARALTAGTGVVVNSTFATRFHRRTGDEITLRTPAGPMLVRIAGIHLELTPGDLGVVRLDRARYREAWRDETVSAIEVALRPGADRATVADAIRTRFGERHRVVVLTVEALRAEYRAMLENLARLVHPLLAVAVASALVGVGGARIAAMLQRARVIVLLRVAGATKRQLVALHCVEGLVIAGLAVTTAAVIGGVLGWMQVAILLRGMLGMTIIYAYPRETAVAAGLSTVGIMALAGWLMGLRAAGVPTAAVLHAH